MTTIVSRRAATAVLLAGVLWVTGGVAPATAAPSQTVRGKLLPVPAGGSATAVDVSPLGVVAGTGGDRPQRWAKIPRAGWLRQQLALPAGATAGTADGLTDLGEVGGAVTVDGLTRAARWSLDGRTATLIGQERSQVTAVGPNGPWGVLTTGVEFNSGEAELVTRGGERTTLRGTPELDAGYRRSVGSIGDPGTALVWTIGGIGRGATGRPVVWRDGATVRLPVFSSIDLGSACVSRILSDGSVVASGLSTDFGTPRFVLIRHVGGVPGTDVVLAQATASDQPFGGIVCGPDQPSPSLASDGGFAGYVVEGGVRHAAFWNAANERQVVPLTAGELSADGVAAAVGGRMVIRSDGADGVVRLSLWRDGVRTPLAVPGGWAVDSVVELTDAGLLVANLRNEAGTIRPAAWELPGR